MSDRRRFERLPIQVPVNVSTTERRDRVGMIRDLSASGLLFHSLSRFAVGERLIVMFKLNHGKGVTAGRVVRAQIDDNLDNFFRFMTAVSFDAPLLDIDLASNIDVQLAHAH